MKIPDIRYDVDGQMLSDAFELHSISTCFSGGSNEKRGHTSCTRPIREVISCQQPQFMGYRCTLCISHRIASSSFLSLARTIP